VRRDAIRGVMAVVVLAATMVGCAGDGQSADSAVGQPDGSGATPKTDTVSITVACGDNMFVKVAPWGLKLKKNGKDDVVFVVDTASNVEAVDITLKSPTAAWPLTDRPPYSVAKANGNGGKKKQDDKAAEGTYSYNISANCSVNGQPRTIVIDPDIFVN
jgi:hypothetical protein